MNAFQTPPLTDAGTLSAIQNDLSSNIYVEAGAGTGKTHSLVQRIVALLKGGVGIDEIIAITFTRAAASELRSRIRAELETLRSENPDVNWVTTALEGIDTAAFQTIDSLVYSLLRENPLECRLPPSVEVQDSFAEMQMFRERWHQWSLERLEDDEGFSKVLSTALRLNMSGPFGTISRLAESMNQRHDELRAADFAAPTRVGIETIINLDELIDDAIGQMQMCRDANDSLYAKFEEVLEWYEKFIKGRDVETEDEADDLIMTWPGTTSSGGRMPNWGGHEGKVQAVRSLQAIINAVKSARDATRQAATNQLIGYASDFVGTIVEERRRAGNVTYYDGMTWLIEMLERNDSIRRRIQNVYRRVLVDEFQDTNPVQVRLVQLLTIPPSGQLIAPGSLFVVGDPKQSIYRFRGAQVNVSQSVRDQVLNDNAGGKYLTLRENRRSTGAIIKWVNHVFGAWMPSEDGQADWIPLGMAVETAQPDAFGKVFHFGAPSEERSLSKVRTSDAEHVASIARAVCDGVLNVRDRHDGSIRPSRPGDITILTSTRTNWETYTREFDQLNLPYTAEIGGAEVLSTQEFRDLLNCLTAIDDPSDQPSTVGALKSVYFGCSDVDLYHWAKAGGKFSCAAEFPNNPDTDAVCSAMKVLNRYNTLRDNLQPPVLIERFIRERQGRELMFLEDDPTPGLRRLDLAVELSRRFTEEGATSLRECLTRFAQLKESNDSIREQPSLEFDEGKIRFMTMHASKGLEFPVVILADLCGTGRSSNLPLLIDWEREVQDGDRIAIRLGGNQTDGFFQTENYPQLAKYNAAADELEKTRLHYVACTRARDYLFVSGSRKENDTRSIAARIEGFVGTDDALWSAVPEEWESRNFQPDSIQSPSKTHRPISDDTAWVEKHRRVLAGAAARSWLTPSNLKDDDAKGFFAGSDEKSDEVPVRESEHLTGRGRAATNIGSAVHAAIQRAIETPNLDIDSIARLEAERHGVTDRVGEVARLTAATLQMPLLRDAALLRRENVWIETPVAVAIPTADGSTKTVEGRVDLIYRKSDGTLGIADFKTDRIFNRSITEMADAYIAQLGAYAYTVQKATGIPVSEASILFSRLAADKRGEGEYRLPNVQAAIELALKLASNQ